MDYLIKKISKIVLFASLPLALFAVFIFLNPKSTQALGEVAVWHFDENSGTTAADSSGNNNTGILTNGPVWTAGRVGNALQFDGVDDYMNMGNGASLNITDNLTLEAWVKPDIQSTLYGIVAGKSSGNWNGWEFKVDAKTDTTTSISFRINGNNASTPAAVLNNGQWYHLVGTYNGTDVLFYVNGVLSSSIIGYSAAIMTNGNYFALSQQNYWYFKGTIDEVKVYNRALTASEVLAEYSGGLSTSTPTPTPISSTTPMPTPTLTPTPTAAPTPSPSSSPVPIAVSSYDSSTNTIYLGIGNNTINSVYMDINNPAVLSYDSAINTYILNAKIDSNGKASLTITDTTLLMNNNIDDEYYITVGWNLIIKNSTIKSNNGKRFFIWAAKAGGGGYSSLIDNVTIDGGYLRYRTFEYMYAAPVSPWVQIYNLTIKNVDMTSAHQITSPTIANPEATVLQLAGNTGLNAILQNITLDNVKGGEIYSGTIMLGSGATNAVLRNMRVINSSHPYRGVYWAYGAIQNLTMENILFENIREGTGIGYSNKEGFANSGVHHYKNMTIRNFSGYGFQTYQNMHTTIGESGPQIENLIIDGGALKGNYIFEHDYAETVHVWVFNAYLANANYGFRIRNNKYFFTNTKIQNVTTMYDGFGGVENGEVNWYELADIYVTDSNGNPINGATVQITPNATAPNPNIVDKWFNTNTNITTGSNGHTPLPSDETGMVALLRKRDSSSGTISTTYSYTITASYSGKTNSIIVTPDSAWYRTDPVVPTNTITIQLPIIVSPTPTPTPTPTPGPVVPSAPQTLSSTAGDSTVSLSWLAPSSNGGSTITGYKIYRGTSSGNETFLANSSVLSYTDSTPINGTTYYYRVTAINSIGESLRSNETIANPQATRIQGTVSDSTGIPIQGATVQTGSNTTTTDSQGNYTLNVSAGVYTVIASNYDYSSQSKSASVIAAQTTTVNFTLIQSDVTPPVRSSSSPSGTLAQGTVQTALTLSTNENATCKYSTAPNTSYSSMPNTFTTTDFTSHSKIITGLTNGQSYVYYVRCQDISLNANSEDYIISLSVANPPADTTPPSLFSGSPFGTLPQNTTQVLLALSTNENATCKYSTAPNTSYSSMPNTFTTTDFTSHSKIITGLTNGQSYNFYIRCQDAADNPTTSDYPISFSVANPPPLPPFPPSRSSGSPFGILFANTTQTNLTLATNENATCKYSTAPNTSYSSMPDTFTTTDFTSHSQTLTGLISGTSYTYYVRCQGSVSSVANSDDYIISFSIASHAPSDVTPPIRSSSSPSGTLAQGTVQTALTLSTNENATCKYSTAPNTSYSSMPNTFTTTDFTSHSKIITGLTNGQSYVYYVRCQDISLNANSEDYIISFSVANPPADISGGGGGVIPSDTIPPSAVTNLTSSSTETQVLLTWTNPTNGDYSKTKILRKLGSFSTSPSDGIAVFDDNKNSFTDSNLSLGATYYYSVYAYDASGNYSVASQTALATKGTYSGTSSYPDSTLLKTPDSIRVYVIIQGKKKWIATPEVFETLGYKWTAIIPISTAVLKAIPDFEDNLIRAIGDIKVFMIVNGIRHHIPNPDIFLDYGFLWSDVKDVPQSTIDQYRLVRLIRESGQSKIYYLSVFGIKKWIPTPEIFSSYNNQWSDIQVISNKEMISYPTSNLMKLMGSSDIYLIEGTTKRLIPSIDVFNKYSYDWAKVLEANQMEFNWYKTGSDVK